VHGGTGPTSGPAHRAGPPAQASPRRQLRTAAPAAAPGSESARRSGPHEEPFRPFQRRGTVVVLALDEDEAAAVATLVRDLAPCRIHTQPEQLGRLLAEEERQLHVLRARHERIVQAWREEATPLVPQIVQLWRARSEAAPVAVVLVDAASAAEASHLLPHVRPWSGTRLLLTPGTALAAGPGLGAAADVQLPKGAPDHLPQLRQWVMEACHAAPEPLQLVWREALQPAQRALLDGGGVARDLQFYGRENFRESIVIGEPFGIIGITRSETLAFVQLCAVDDLAAMAAAAAAAGMAADVAEDVRAGRMLVDLDLQRSLGHGAERATPVEAFSLGGGGTLLAAVRRL